MMFENRTAQYVSRDPPLAKGGGFRGVVRRERLSHKRLSHAEAFAHRNRLNRKRPVFCGYGRGVAVPHDLGLTTPRKTVINSEVIVIE